MQRQNSRVRGAGKWVTLCLNFIGAIRFRRDIQGRTPTFGDEKRS